MTGVQTCALPIYSLRELARESEAVIIMVKADAEVEEVILGNNGILEGAKPGFIIINSSTISPKTSIRLAAKTAKAGVEILDAPVTGSGVQAIEAKLTFMVGGNEEVFKRCMPLFTVMGKQAFYMGESGKGSYTKLGNNVMLAINLLAVSEALTLIYKAGIDPEVFLQVVDGGGARSGMAETKIPKIVKRDYKPAFGTAMLAKDLALASDLARELQVPVPVMSTVKEMVQIAVAKGFSDEDVCSVIKCYEEWAGIEIK